MREITEHHASQNKPSPVEAILNYIVRSSEKPVVYAYEPPPGIPPITGQSEPHSVQISNARLEPNLSLDRQGFQLITHETAVHDFYDPVQVERIYYPEVELLLKQATGAEKVVIFDYQIRNRQPYSRGETKAGDYVLVVHNDFTAISGPRRVRDHLPPAEAKERLQYRFADINVWRPIRGPVESTPLAVCDARSIDPVDFVPTDFAYREKVGEVYRLAYNPKHRWFYFPGLESNEVILLKCYDSSKDGRARFSAHSGFDDPTSPSDAPAWESIEVRTLVFWRADR
jgi:hypothetical protein